MTRRLRSTEVLTALCLLAPALPGGAQTASDPASWVPALAPLENPSPSELRDVVGRFTADFQALQRRFDTPHSPDRLAALRGFLRGWTERVETIDFEPLAVEGRIDWILLARRLRHELRLLDREEERLRQAAPLAPFAPAVLRLADARRRLDTLDPRDAAKTLTEIADAIERVRADVEAGLPAAARPSPTPTPHAAAARAAAKPPTPLRPTRIVAYRAASFVREAREALSKWFRFSDGYDPAFDFWCRAPHARADAALTKYAAFLREKVVGWKEGDDEPIVGDPIGRAAILEDLADELIPYTPEELVAIAEREFAWCEAEMKKASAEMGLGDDWKKALEKVKEDYVVPGRQADLVRDLSREAVAFVEKNDLITVPPLADVVWRMEMMSPERQKVNPFFLGGEEMLVSFPTESMAADDKRMSLRGNNVHFARATVFHEQIPGHHLQAFVDERWNPHRNAFDTPFFVEGWALHWEMLFWDLGFHRTPEDRIGALWWRMHRCARIVFSLGFHLGKMTPDECIEFLVARVGHERANAVAEVRRSFNGDYSPLYQLAYMIGALQFNALHRELVGAGKMSERAFHDAAVRAGDMPLAMVRASLTREKLPKTYEASWRFAGEPLGKR
jgi:hypothetical protein